MRKLLLFSILVCSFVIIIKAQAPVLINLGTTTVETSTLYTSSEPPWELKYGPGDSLWMTTKNGKVYRIDPLSGNATMLLDYSATVYQGGEAGMLGMTFHPDFSANPYVYIAYTYSSGGNKERLSRFTYTGTSLTTELILIDNIVASTIHNGSRLVILPDNTILMTTGDAANTAYAQDINSLNGKVLRVNLDGTIPADNPTAGSRLYTFGHRNAQGLYLHPNGMVYSTEHGPGNNDEFQIIEKGRNYGWPNVEGFCDNDISGETAFCTANDVKEPLASWNPVPGGTWAPSDLVWYSHPSIPEFQNSFLVAFLKTQKVRSIRLNAAGDGITAQADYFVNQWGRLRDITAGPDGSIYIATNVNPFRIIKIKSTGTTAVHVTNFKATCNQNKLMVNWTSQTEVNNRHFMIYRSNDGQNYTLAATIASNAPGGNSFNSIQYNFTDIVNNAPVFYKLVSEDKDGKKENWGIISPVCNEKGIRFSLSPNPARTESILNITGASTPLNIIVNNGIGQAVYQIKTNNTVRLPVQKWQPGIYYITVTDDQKKVLFRQKLIAQ